MIFFLFIFIFLIFYFRDILSCILFNFKDFIRYFFLDFVQYFTHKKYNLCKLFGKIYIYTADGSQVFGSGKTASMVNDVISTYHKYNNKKVYDEKSKKWVIQRIHIISNVELYQVPYIKFTSINQFIDIEKLDYPDQDITIYLIDESGAIFNSREFRNNISMEFLTKLIQSRKNKCCLFMTSQRLQFTDKILREICGKVISCKKTWRFMFNTYYDALQLEYAINPTLIRSKGRKVWFGSNEKFERYNSYQLIEQLRKDYKPDDFLDTKEIIDTYGVSETTDISPYLKKKYKKTS